MALEKETVFLENKTSNLQEEDSNKFEGNVIL